MATLTDLEPGNGEFFQFFSIVKDSQVSLPLPLRFLLTQTLTLLPCHVLPGLVNDIEAEPLGFKEIRGASSGCGEKQLKVLAYSYTVALRVDFVQLLCM